MNFTKSLSLLLIAGLAAGAGINADNKDTKIRELLQNKMKTSQSLSNNTGFSALIFAGGSFYSAYEFYNTVISIMKIQVDSMCALNEDIHNRLTS